MTTLEVELKPEKMRLHLKRSVQGVESTLCLMHCLAVFHLYICFVSVVLSWSPASRWIQDSSGHHVHSCQSMCTQPESPSQCCFLWSPLLGCWAAGASPTDTFWKHNMHFNWILHCMADSFNTGMRSSLVFIHLISPKQIVLFHFFTSVFHSQNNKETMMLQMLSGCKNNTLQVSDYLKLKSPLGTTGTLWDILTTGDVVWGDPQRRAP